MKMEMSNKEAKKFCEQYEKDYLKRHGYSMDEMIIAEQEIQANIEHNKLRCTKCEHWRLIDTRDYLDIKNGKKKVFTCNKCGAEMVYKWL